MDGDVFVGAGPIPGTPRSPQVADDRAALTDPNGYQADPALARAVNIALRLGMPLLVTGEPGTGKTQLAFRVAREFGLEPVLRFDTKSSSQASELFYTYDTIRHYAQAQLDAAAGRPAPSPAAYLQYAALGLAILRSRDPQGADRELMAPYIGGNYVGGAPVRSVVLIDEIDKAPRDFPNDLLNQIEERAFYVPELAAPRVQAAAAFAPIVIITSNSEKQLPEPFLRRCVYHHIEFPRDRAAIEQILGGRLANLKLGGPGYESAIDFFFKLRDHGTMLSRRPSTAELLDWLRALRSTGFRMDLDLSAQREVAAGCLGSLLKGQADKAEGLRLLGA